MPLPIMTTTDDVVSLINYLKTKPTGASLEAAKAAIDNRLLDGRKISAYRYWGIIEKESDKLSLTEQGWDISRKPESIIQHFRNTIKNVEPYFSVLEWAHYQKLDSLTVIDVVRHWSKNFSSEVESEETAKDQAACFFRFCEGADLGQMVIGRRGSPTRLEIKKANFVELITGEFKDLIINSELESIEYAEPKPTPSLPIAVNYEKNEMSSPLFDSVASEAVQSLDSSFYKRVYISHGKNTTFIDSIRKLLAFGELEAVVSIYEPSVSVPVPEKIMEEMRSCGGAIIHVDTEEVLLDKEGNERLSINQNVLIEIGAAMALYGRRFILLVKNGVKLPSNLQGLFEVRYSGDSLDGDTTIRLLDTIMKLKQEKIPE